MKDLTRQEIINYMKSQGLDVEDQYVDWWVNTKYRRAQIVECVKNNYDILDFDEWQDLQDILFGEDSNATISFEAARKISTALSEENINVLDLPFSKIA